MSEGGVGCGWGLAAPAHPFATILWPRVTWYYVPQRLFWKWNHFKLKLRQHGFHPVYVVGRAEGIPYGKIEWTMQKSVNQKILIRFPPNGFLAYFSDCIQSIPTWFLLWIQTRPCFPINQDLTWHLVKTRVSYCLSWANSGLIETSYMLSKITGLLKVSSTFFALVLRRLQNADEAAILRKLFCQTIKTVMVVFFTCQKFVRNTIIAND